MMMIAWMKKLIKDMKTLIGSMRIMKIRGAILGELAEVKAKKRRRHKR